ncbi:MAG: DUF2147 domain-containing protein [Bacteroidota bacterium]
MKKLFTFSMLLFISITTSNAQSVTGKWYSIDSETNAKKSIIEVYQQNNKIYAKILELVKEEDKGKLCDKCEGKNHNKPIEGMVILDGLSKDGDEWSGGKILDPKNGSIYKCYIELVEKNKLKIRGYIGFSLIGRTEYWYREK